MIAHLMKRSLFATCTILSLCLNACSLQNSTNSLTHTAFLSNIGVPASSRSDRLPFQHSWRDPDVRIDDYKNIVVRPVTTRYLDTSHWTNSRSPWIPSEKSFKTNAINLAKYWDAALKHSFSSPLCSYYLKQGTNQPQTLILEIAITQITFARPTPSAVAVASLINTATGPPLVAFEARVKDAATGKIVATASDLRTDRLDLRDFTKAQRAMANQEICKEWSEQLMQATNRELFAKVRGSWFTGF